MPPFHLAFPILDIAATRAFYSGVLGCAIGREDTRWIDFDFFGHQLSAHLVDTPPAPEPTNQVDGKAVPVRHFGVVLDWDDWQQLAQRLRDARTEFLIEPHIRFAGRLASRRHCLLPTHPATDWNSNRSKIHNGCLRVEWR